MAINQTNIRNKQILVTRWRDIPFEEIPKNHLDSNFSIKELKENWNKKRGTEVKVFIPSSKPLISWCNQPSYQRVDNNFTWVCSCLVEIGD